MNYKTYEQIFRRKALDEGYSDSNIAKCLKYAKPLIENNFPVIYNSSHLSSLVGYKRSYIKRAFFFTEYFYRTFTIKKKNGRFREISEPLPSLKEIQLWILNNILYSVPTSKFSKAYSPKKTLIDNVRFHKGQDKVVCIDIKDFFPSIKFNHIELIFKEIGYSTRVTAVLSKLCCLKGSLPQGAPTSPYLTNIYLRDLDEEIASYCVKNKIRYTRYADDLTFSGEFVESELLEFAKTAILKKELRINPDKTVTMTRNMRQVVTGVIVNKKLQIPIEKRKEIRQSIYFIELYGLASHLQKIRCSKSNYLKHLLGLINYTLFINPNDKESKLQKEFINSLIKDSVLPNVYKKS